MMNLRPETIQLMIVGGGIVNSLICLYVAKQVRTVHTLVNSRMSELLEVATKGSRAEGKIEGKEEGRVIAKEEKVEDEKKDEEKKNA